MNPTSIVILDVVQSIHFPIVEHSDIAHVKTCLAYVKHEYSHVHAFPHTK